MEKLERGETYSATLNWQSHISKKSFTENFKFIHLCTVANKHYCTRVETFVGHESDIKKFLQLKPQNIVNGSFLHKFKYFDEEALEVYEDVSGTLYYNGNQTITDVKKAS